MKIKAAIATAPRTPFVIEEVDLDDPRSDEVVVEVCGSGLCHTDIVARDLEYPVPQPLVCGHEGSGIVHAVGDAVTSVAVGDRVVLTFVSCGECRPCRIGRPAYCVRLYELNFSGRRPDGSTTLRRGSEELFGSFFGQSSFASYAIAFERNVIKVPDDVPLELLGPLGCGVQTGAGAVFNSLRPQAGASIAVFGMGAVGLSAVMAARAVGAGPIIAVDVRQERLEKARSLGATETIDARDGAAVEAIREITNGGAEFSLEMAGRPEVLRQAIDCLGPLGACGLVGAAPFGVEASFEMAHVLFNGKQLIGICEGDSVPELFIPRLIALFKSGTFPIDQLTTKFSLDDINDAVDATDNGDVIKAILIPN